MGGRSEGDSAHSWGLPTAKGILLPSQQAGNSAGSWGEPQDSSTHEISVLLPLPRTLNCSPLLHMMDTTNNFQA